MYFRINKLALALLISGLTPLAVGVRADETEAATNEAPLETVVVSAAREPLPRSRVGSALSLLDEETLRQRQGANLGELLRSLPGVAVSRAGGLGAQTQMRVRGSEANHLKVLLDGIPVNDAAQGDELNIAHLFNVNLEQVELLRGPQSSLWGSDALAGVLSLTSKKPEEGSQLSGFLEGGSESYLHGGANFGWAGERGYLTLSGRQISADGHNVSRIGGEDDGYKNSSLSVGGGLWLTDNMRASTAWHFVDSTTDFDSVDFASGLPADRNNETDAEQLYGNLALSVDLLDARWRQRLSINVIETDNANSEESAFAPTGFTRSSAASERLQVVYESHYDIQPEHTMSLALEHSEADFSQRGEASFFGDPNRDESMETASAVLEYRGRVSENFFVQASVRHADNADFDDTTTWRANAAWQLTGALKLRAGVGTGVKDPTFSERFGFFTNFVGNPDLEPEQSRSWEIGVDGSSGLFDWQLTYFQARLEDEINGFVFLPGVGAFTAANESGESDRSGVELSSQWSLGDNLDVAVAYTWLEATEDEFGREVDEIRRPRHTGSVDIGWRAADQLKLHLRGDHNGAQDDLFFPPVPPFQERVELADFTLVSLLAEWEISQALSVHARVENALDEDYEEVFGFATPGRTFVLGFRLQTNRK